jgi:hypothetical protein
MIDSSDNTTVAGTIPRTKIHLANGNKVYVYGPINPRPGLTQEEINGATLLEPAGHYDPARNEVVMTEPTLIEEGIAYYDLKKVSR